MSSTDKEISAFCVIVPHADGITQGFEIYGPFTSSANAFKYGRDEFGYNPLWTVQPMTYVRD